MDLSFEACLRAHMENHREETAQDIVKFCYQAAFGAEHLLKDLSAARAYFMDEYESVSADASAPLFEPLNDRYSRVNISAWKACGRGADELFDLFVKTAGMPEREQESKILKKEQESEILKKEQESVFTDCLLTAEKLIKNAESLRNSGRSDDPAGKASAISIADNALTTVSPADWETFLKEYGKSRQAVRHSAVYREKYAPAYRLVKNRLLGESGLLGEGGLSVKTD